MYSITGRVARSESIQQLHTVRAQLEVCCIFAARQCIGACVRMRCCYLPMLPRVRSEGGWWGCVCRICSTYACVLRCSREDIRRGGGGPLDQIRGFERPTNRAAVIRLGRDGGGAARAVAWLRLALRVVAAGEGEAC